MKILKIEIDQEDEKKVFEELIKHFDTTKSDIFGKGQSINFPLNEQIEVYSELSIYHDKPEPPDENNQCAEPNMYPDMYGFKLDFCIDGEEIEVVRNNVIGLTIEDKVRNYYTK